MVDSTNDPSVEQLLGNRRHSHFLRRCSYQTDASEYPDHLSLLRRERLYFSFYSRTLRRLFFRITFTPSPRASSSFSKGPLSFPLSRSDLLSPDLSQPLTQVLFAHYLEPLVVEGDQTVSRDLFEALLQAAESNHHVTPVIQ